MPDGGKMGERRLTNSALARKGWMLRACLVGAGARSAVFFSSAAGRGDRKLTGRGWFWRSALAQSAAEKVVAEVAATSAGWREFMEEA
jgi:hypothetical protein